MAYVVAPWHLGEVERVQLMRDGAPISPSTSQSSGSSAERREPDLDSAWNPNAVNVFEHQRRVPTIIKAQLHQSPVRDDASAAAKRQPTISSATTTTQNLQSIAEEPQRRYATDKEDEGVAHATKKCMSSTCFAKLAPSWHRRGATNARVEPAQSQRGKAVMLTTSTSTRGWGYVNVQDNGDLRKEDYAGSTQCETEQSHLASENSSQERFCSSTPHADKNPDPNCDSNGNTWEEFDGGNRRWFQSCKMWPPKEDAVVQDLQRRDSEKEQRYSEKEQRDELVSSKVQLENSAATSYVPVPSRSHTLFPRTTPFVVHGEQHATAIAEAPLVLGKDGPPSPARSHYSSSSSISQASGFFVIQKHDYELAAQGLSLPVVVANPSFASHDDDADLAFILQVGLD